MRFIAALLVAVLLTPVAHGQEKKEDPVAPELPPDIPPGEDVIEPLHRGEAAPFEGLLMDLDTSMRWANRLRWYRENTKLQLKLRDDTVAAVRASHQRELTLVTESYTREIEGCRGDLRQQAATFAAASDTPFYKTFSFGLVLGVILSGGLVGLTAAIATR